MSEELPVPEAEAPAPKKRRIIPLIGAGVIAAASVGGGAYALGRRAGSAPTAPATAPARLARAPFTAGTIAAIDGDRITLATDNGNITVTTSPETVVTSSRTGTLSDVHRGDNVSVVSTSDSSATAERITDTGAAPPSEEGPATFGGPPPGEQVDPPPDAGASGRTVRIGGPRVAGKVTSVDTSSITVAQADGTTKTLATTASTVVSIVTPTTVSALGAGTDVTVVGERADDGTIAARSIRAGDTAMPPLP